jgi:polyisoprenoid-binding protein YceI
MKPSDPRSGALLLAATATLLAMPAWGAQSTWQLDPAHSAATFAVRHLMISTVRGEFSKVTGTVLFDQADPAKSNVNVTIDATTVNTREPDRDEDLRSDHFLDVKEFPTMTFHSTKMEAAGTGKLKMTGDLTIRGITNRVVFDVEGPSQAVKDPWGNQRMAASATTKINRQDFGVKWNAKMDDGGVVVGDEVTITLDVEMTKQDAGSSSK